MSASAMMKSIQLGWLDKILALIAVAIAVTLFLTVGWMAAAPVDPRGAVSLVANPRVMGMIVQTAALVAISSAIATVMIGGKLPDAGMFAAALGMGFLSLHGNTAAYLLITVARGDHQAERVLAGKFAAEGMLWVAMLILAAVVASVVSRWCWSEAEGGVERGGSLRTATEELRSLLRTSEDGSSPMLSRPAFFAGLKATGITAAVAGFWFPLLASGSSPRTIAHGQVCFAVFASFYIGTWICKRVCPLRTSFFPLLAVPLTALVGYLSAIVYNPAPSGRHTQLASIPGNDFLRVLPMTFVAVATLGVLTACWFIAPSQPKPETNRLSTSRSRHRKSR